MFYITVSEHSKFEKCRATLDERTGLATVWIDLWVGRMAMDSGEVDDLINALSDALTEARTMEQKHRDWGV